MVHSIALLCCTAVLAISTPPSAALSVSSAATVHDNTEELLRHPDPLSLIQVDLGAEIEAEIKAAADKEFQEEYHFDATRISLLDMIDQHADRVALKEYTLRLNGHGWSLLDLKDTYLHSTRRRLHHEHRLKVAQRRGRQAYKSHTLGHRDMRFRTLRGMQHDKGPKCGDRASCDACISPTDKKHCVWRVDTKKDNKQFCDSVSMTKRVPASTKSFGKAKGGSSMMPTKANVVKETCPTPEDLAALAPAGAEAGAATAAVDAPAVSTESAGSASEAGKAAGEIDPEKVEAQVDATIGPLTTQADKTIAAEDAKMATTAYDKKMLEAHTTAEKSAKKRVTSTALFKNLVADIEKTTNEEVALLEELKKISETGLTKASCEKVEWSAESMVSMVKKGIKSLGDKLVKFGAYMLEMAKKILAGIIKGMFFLVKFIGNLLMELVKLLSGTLQGAATWIKDQKNKITQSRCEGSKLNRIKDEKHNGVMDFCPVEDPFNKHGDFTCWCRPQVGSPSFRWWPMGSVDPMDADSIPKEGSEHYNDAIDLCVARPVQWNVPAVKRTHADCKALFAEAVTLIKTEPVPNSKYGDQDLGSLDERQEGNGCYKYEKGGNSERNKGFPTYAMVTDLTDALMEGYDITADKFRQDMLSDDAMCADDTIATCPDNSPLHQGTCKNGNAPTCADGSKAKPIKMTAFESMKILKKRQLSMVNNREKEREQRNYCSQGKVWKVVSILASPLNLAREVIAAMLPDLVILGLCFSAVGTVSGLEIVTDHQTYENSVFAFGGLNTGSLGGAGFGMYLGFGWKGSTSHTPVEESYKGWFVGAEPSAAPPIPPWSMMGSLCAGFYSSGAPDDGTLEISKGAALLDNAIDGMVGVEGDSAAEYEAPPKMDAVKKAMAVAGSLAVVPLLHAVKSVGIGISVGPSINVNMPGSPLDVAYVQTFYVYLAGTCTAASEGPRSNRWIQFITKMLVDAVKAMNPALLLAAVVNAIYGIFHRLVNGARSPVDEQCSVHHGKGLEFREMLKGAFGNKHVIPEIGYMPKEITKAQGSIDGKLRSALAISDADQPAVANTNFYEHFKSILATVAEKAAEDTDNRNEVANVEMDTSLSNKPVEDGTYGCYIESLQKYTDKLKEKTDLLRTDLNTRVYGSETPPGDGTLAPPPMKAKSGSMKSYMYRSMKSATSLLKSAANTISLAASDDEDLPIDQRKAVLAGQMCRLDEHVLESSGNSASDAGAAGEAGASSTAATAGAPVAAAALVQLATQPSAKFRFASVDPPAAAGEAGANPENIKLSDVKDPLCKPKEGNDFFINCDDNCHPTLPSLSSMPYGKHANLGEKNWNMNHGGGTYFTLASTAQETPEKFSPWDLGAPPTNDNRSPWKFKTEGGFPATAQHEISSKLEEAHRALKLYLTMANRRREFLELEFDHQVRKFNTLRDSELAWAYKFDLAESYPDQRKQLLGQAEKLVATAYPATEEKKSTAFGGGEGEDDIAKSWQVIEEVSLQDASSVSEDEAAEESAEEAAEETAEKSAESAGAESAGAESAGAESAGA